MKPPFLHQQEQKADSRENAQNVENSAKDSRNFAYNAPNLNDSQAEGFCDDFAGCQGAGEGIYLSGNEQAHAADSRKSAQKPTPKHTKTPPMLCGCAEFEYIGKDPYTLRLTSGHTYNIKRGQHFIVSRGNLANFLKFKKTLFKLVQQG